MKKNFLLMIHIMTCVILIVLLHSCNKDDYSILPVNSPGKAFPEGTVTGAKVEKEIGASGGRIISDDGHMKITIPSGAVDKSTPVSIQRISNTNPGGVGNAYRLLPHGENFKIPVTVQFSYGNMLDSITSNQTIGIAYQDDKRVWNWKSAQINDTTSKTISLQTTHFSDWSFMEFLFLRPSYATLEAGGSKTFQAMRCIPGDELIVPLNLQPSQPDIPVGDIVPLELKHIKDWELGGVGELITLGNSAVYTAPAVVKKDENATLALILNTSKGKAMLVSHIRIISKEYLYVRVNGSEPLYLKGEAGKDMDGSFFIGTTTPGKWFVINGPFAKGSFAWNNGEGGGILTQFAYSVAGGSHDFYGSYYFEGNALKKSGGWLTIQSVDAAKKIIEGVFTVTPSGRVSGSAGGQTETANIEGGFKLRY